MSDVATPALENASQPMLGKVAPLPPLLPGALPFLGHAHWQMRNPVLLHQKALASGSDLVRVKFPVYDHAFICFDADAVEDIFVKKIDQYTKNTMGFLKLRKLIGLGLLTSDGEYWQKHRRIAQPAFHRQRLAGFVNVMQEEAIKTCEKWGKENGKPQNVTSEMMQTALRIVTRSLFSSQVEEEVERVGHALDDVMQSFIRDLYRSNSPLKYLPSKSVQRLEKSQKNIEDVVMNIIARRRESKEQHHDLLAMLMETRDEETGHTMNDTQLRDEVMTLFLAGHETTATLLQWLLQRLASEPQVVQNMRTEIQAVLEGRALTLEDLPKLKYIRCVVQEGLRLYPPAWAIGRLCEKEDVLAGWRIPANSLLFLSTWALHRNPKYWENPEDFRPERFFPEEEAKRQKGSFIPFGSGPRTCIGNSFALFETQTLLTEFFRRFDFQRVGEEVKPNPSITLRAEKPVHLKLVPLEKPV